MAIIKRATDPKSKAYWKSLEDIANPTCKAHPRYKVIRKPRVACEACWFMWFNKLGRECFGW
jgi:hypothetical protein